MSGTTPNLTPRYVSIPDAADYLGVRCQTVRRYIETGRLTAYRLGPRSLRVTLAELDSLFIPLEQTASRA